MSECFSHRSAREAAVQKRLDEQAKLFRERLGEARGEVNHLLDEVSRLRRNPLARPFANAALLEQVRKVKKALCHEVTLPKRDERLDQPANRPRRFGFTAEELERMTPEQLALVANAAAVMVDQNLDLMDIPYDAKLAMLATGNGSKDIFNYVGVEWLEAMIRYGRLAPHGTVLDIGCGCGRMAGPLTLYLNKQGSFVGFEPVAEAVAHAQAHLQQSNFRFEHADLNHYLYNPQGKVKAGDYRFPCEDGSVHVSIAGSIFTHLDLETANHYLRETRRVLRPGGRALYSLFSLMEGMKVEEGKVTAPLGAPAGDGRFRFLNRGHGIYTHSDEQGKPANHFVPDPIGDPVAFDHQAFMAMAGNAGLAVEHFLPGSWCRKEYVHGYQDMFVLRKPA